MTMDLRLAVYELAAQHQLDASAMQRLQQCAGLHREPAGLSVWLLRGVAILAAALGGFGIILWVAANWETFGRFGRFALLQGFFVVMCLGALWRPAARSPLCLLAWLAIGGLFAYFGQTYQTGADPWQLFALWAVLSAPLCWSARSDVLWTPWALVAMTAISLWVHAHAGYRWRVEGADLPVHVIGWSAAVLLALMLSPLLRRWTGAGLWALRMTLVLLIFLITTTAFLGLFETLVAPHYWLALLVLSGVAVVLSVPQFYELFGLSAVGLSLNILIVAGLARVMLKGQQSDLTNVLSILGFTAAGLLAVTVHMILRLSHRRQREGASA